LAVGLMEGRIASLRSAFDLHARLDPLKHEGIRRAVDAHAELRRFEQASRLAVLAQFAIIEMLLTHNPNDKEIGDSITHQLKTKIALISARMASGFDYSVFSQKDVNPEKIWAALYAYRSSIAHGGHIDFVSKLKILVTEETARAFIASATRIIINYALEEPDLVNALKPI
jgi:Apea-like HEPN